MNDDTNMDSYGEVLIELAMQRTPAGRAECIAHALNAGRLTPAQALHLMDLPVSTSAKATDE